MRDLNKIKELERYATEQENNWQPVIKVRTRDILDIAEAFRLLNQRLEATEKRMAELESDNASLCQTRADLSREANSFEAELARRDKDAGEPVYICPVCEPNNEMHCICPSVQPAALPPEATVRDGPYMVINGQLNKSWATGANWMREQAKSLGVKPLRVKLPSVRDCCASHIKNRVALQRIEEALKAQGIEVEE